MKTTLRFSLLIFAVLALGLKASNEPFLELLKKLDSFTSSYPQEKVYLQFDKPYYAVGDDIWLKAYVLNTKSQEPSQLSGMIDVELIDELDQIRAAIRLPLKDGAGRGDFNLPDSLIEGNYRIRAYTPYMRNFSSDFFFEKNIKVGKSWSNDVFVSSNFSYKKEKEVEQTVTTIQLNDQNEKPYGRRSVAYQVLSGTKVIEKGRMSTDENGNMEITFPDRGANAQAGIIKLEISLDRNKIVYKTIPISSFATSSDVQFFPEGGQLVEGHPQKIAFKASGAKGHGVTVTGDVIDEAGTVMASFRTEHLGMGSFNAHLLANKQYFAAVKFADGSQKKVPLPMVASQGYTLSINNMDADALTIRVTASAALANGGDVKIVGQQAGNIRFVLSGKLNSQTLVTSVPKKKFSAGIAQITIFSPDDKPVAERLVFIKQPSDLINLELDTSALSYIPTGKSKISFNAGEFTGSFAVSVTNSNMVTPDVNGESNILTSLLLSGDIAGYIEKPNHYFLNDDAKTARELDNLMMTQGWRRFTWQDVMEDRLPEIEFAPQWSVAVSGRVQKGKKMLPKTPVFLMSKNGGDIARDTLTDKEGRFSFDKLVFADSTQLLVQASPLKKGAFLELMVDQPNMQSMTANRSPADMDPNVSGTLKKYISESGPMFTEMERKGFLKKTIQLNTVNITAERRKKNFEYSANRNGPGNADQTLTADDLPPYYATLDLALGNMLRGIKIIKGKAYMIRGFLAADERYAMTVYLNGTRLFDGDLERISAMDVQAVEVLTSISKQSLYQHVSGTLLITTKRGLGYTAKKPGVLDFDHATVQPKGFYTAREFYVPEYKQDVSQTADYRTTVFWEPNILRDNKGNYNIEFFNTKRTGNYRVVIEGMNKLGQLARTSFYYQVKNGI